MRFRLRGHLPLIITNEVDAQLTQQISAYVAESKADDGPIAA
jgi:hypothetical protein